MKNRWLSSSVAGLVVVCSLCAAFLAVRKGRWPALAMMASVPLAGHAQETGPTVIHVSDTALRTNVRRLGMNLGGENFYNSGQITKNLMGRNPGFEGEELQTVLQCAKATATSCTDYGRSGNWGDGYLDGAEFEVVAGAAKGLTGKITHSTGVNKATKEGITINFAQGDKTPAGNDFFVIRKKTQGGGLMGWGTYMDKGATITDEFKDLSPSTPGKQALRLSASGPGQFAAVKGYFDSTGDKTYVLMHGPYEVNFRAKGVTGGKNLSIRLRRATGPMIFEKQVMLSGQWQDYSLPFTAADTGAGGTAELSFSVFGGEVLLDDVSLEEATKNGTVFRDAVVQTLDKLKLGTLRYMDGQVFGASIDNLLSPPFGHVRTNWNKYSVASDQVPIGLHDFLTLCEKIGAEPWFTMPIGIQEQEGKNLIEYLSGPASTKYGAKRAKLGHPAPWSDVFPKIHLEYGNETWNQVQAGAVIPQPIPYADRAKTILMGMRSSPSFVASKYDLIVNGQAVNIYFNGKVVEVGEGFDSIDIAPYLFTYFGDDSSVEAIYGPMFAQPEMLDNGAKGYVKLQADVVAKAKRPINLEVYETNIGTTDGTVGQGTVDSVVPTLGAGLTSTEHMLLMLRDLGVTAQNTFELAGYRAPFINSKTHEKESSPVWGVVVDMGGTTNRVRPAFLTQQLANDAIRPTMLETKITGENPTWDQPQSSNASVVLQGAHELQTFAFTDEKSDTMILFNLSRTTPREVRLAGAKAPKGTVAVRLITGKRIIDGNEEEEKVKIVTHLEHDVVPEKTVFTLPPFSMTELVTNR